MYILVVEVIISLLYKLIVKFQDLRIHVKSRVMSSTLVVKMYVIKQKLPKKFSCYLQTYKLLTQRYIEFTRTGLDTNNNSIRQEWVPSAIYMCYTGVTPVKLMLDWVEFLITIHLSHRRRTLITTVLEMSP